MCFGMNDAMFVYIHVCVMCVWVRMQMLNMFLLWLRLRHNDGRPTLGWAILGVLIPYFVRPRFVCQTLENPKISFSLLAVTRTWHGVTHLDTRALKVPFTAKITKMPLVSPRLTKGQTRSKSPQNNIFEGFISNLSSSKIFTNFDQVWPGVDLGWVQKL